MQLFNKYLNTNNVLFVVGGVLVAAGVTTALGTGLKTGGVKLVGYAGNGAQTMDVALRNLGHASQAIGTATFIGGKALAYSILIPAYTIGYVVPKWFIKEGLPKAYSLGRDHVVVPLTPKVIAAAKYVGEHIVKVAVLANDYVLQPIFKGFFSFSSSARNGIIRGFEAGREHVIRPLVNHTISAAKYGVDNVVSGTSAIAGHLAASAREVGLFVRARLSGVFAVAAKAHNYVVNDISFVLQKLRLAAKA